MQLKFGRNRPRALGPRLSLKNYLLKSLPAPPETVNYRGRAFNALRQVYGNDTLGDCVIAGMAHVTGVLTSNAGDPFLYTQDQIVALYSAIGGYVPGNASTDNGCDELTALNYWLQHGAPAGSHAIMGYVAVDPSNPEEYRTALWLFENLFFGLELPDAWVNPFPSTSNFVWDVAGAPDPNNGHCVIGCGYTPRGVTVSTWGMAGVMTDAAIAEYCDQYNGGALYAVMSADQILKAHTKATNGFNASQLMADFQVIGG